MNFTFIHVNYNNSFLTINCVESILNIKVTQNNNKKIIIVDNGSRIEEKDKLINWQKKIIDESIILVFNDLNLGYFKAINIAISLLNNEEKKSYIIIGNNDLKFDESFISNLQFKKYDKNIYVIAPNIINTDGVHQNPHLIKKISLLKRIYYLLYNTNYNVAIVLNYIVSIFSLRSSQKDKLGFEKSRFITMGFGACYILTPYFFIRNEKLDDYLFLMGEEAMLANQILKSGGRSYYDSSLIVYHDDHATFKNIPAIQTYNFNRESYQISKKNFNFSEIHDKQI